MHGLLKRPGYRLHAPDSPEGRELLAEQDLTRAHLEQALARYQEATGTRIGTIVGINEDGVFGTTRDDRHAHPPAGCNRSLVPLLWLQVLELLGRVPEGSTARFLKDGILPD